MDEKEVLAQFKNPSMKAVVRSLVGVLNAHRKGEIESVDAGIQVSGHRGLVSATIFELCSQKRTKAITSQAKQLE